MGNASSDIVYVCVEMVGHTRSAQGSAQGLFVVHREGVDTEQDDDEEQDLGVLDLRVHVRVIVQSLVLLSSMH